MCLDDLTRTIMIKFFLLLLFFLLVTGQTDTQSRTLFQWCLRESECRQAYGQTRGEDFKLFSFLIRSHWEDETTNTDVFGEPNAVEKTKRILLKNLPAERKETPMEEEENLSSEWVSHLLLWRFRSKTACAMNQAPIVDYSNGVVDCLCIEDRQCWDDQSTNPLVFLMLIVILMLLVIQVSFDAFRISQAITEKREGIASRGKV
jgi:hypothetical protein